MTDLARRIAEHAMEQHGTREGHNAGFMVIAESDLRELIDKHLPAVEQERAEEVRDEE